MKKIITCILTVSCISLLGGCSGSNTGDQQATAARESLDSTGAQISDETESGVPGAESAISRAGSVFSGTVTAMSKPASGQPDTTSGSASYIGEEAAMQAALKHAGLTEDGVNFIKAKLDREDRKTVYDIEFYSGNTEYDYEIDAYTGEIISCDFDIDNYIISQSGSTNAAPNSNDGAYITSDAAKVIALEKAGCTETGVTYKEVSFEYEDGMAVYQIEFISGGMEYELEINAVDGAVMEYSAEPLR